MLFAFETSTNFLSININYGKKNHNYCAIKNLSTYFKKFYYFQYQIDIFTYYPTLKINVNLLSTYANQIMQKFMKQSRNTYHAEHKEM